MLQTLIFGKSALVTWERTARMEAQADHGIRETPASRHRPLLLGHRLTIPNQSACGQIRGSAVRRGRKPVQLQGLALGAIPWATLRPMAGLRRILQVVWVVYRSEE